MNAIFYYFSTCQCVIRTNARRREKGSKLLSTKFLVMFFIERKSEICKVQLKMVTLFKNKSRIPHRSDTNSSKANREPVKSSMIKFNHFVGKKYLHHSNRHSWWARTKTWIYSLFLSYSAVFKMFQSTKLMKSVLSLA